MNDLIFLSFMIAISCFECEYIGL